MNEYRLRAGLSAGNDPTDWDAIGARIVEAAEQASAMHMQLVGGQVMPDEAKDFLRRISTDG